MTWLSTSVGAALSKHAKVHAAVADTLHSARPGRCWSVIGGKRGISRQDDGQSSAGRNAASNTPGFRVTTLGAQERRDFMEGAAQRRAGRIGKSPQSMRRDQGDTGQQHPEP